MLMVFASVFVGGTSAYGGEGTIYGSFVGAIIIGIIEAGIVSAGLVGFWTRFVHGFVIILSVSIYALLARKKGYSNLRLWIPSAPEWSNRSLASLLRPVALATPSLAWLRLVGTSCADTGPPRRKATLANHYLAARNT